MNKTVEKIIENNIARETLAYLITFIFVFIELNVLDIHATCFDFILITISTKVFIELLIYNVLVRMTLFITKEESNE